MRVANGLVVAVCFGLLAACGDDKASGPPTGSTADASVSGDGGAPDAGAPRDVAILGQDAGRTPFIALVTLGGTSLPDVTDLAFTVDPKPGSASKPVSASYSIGALQARGYVVDAGVTVPVFGLYAGYDNTGSVELTFRDGATQRLPLEISTAPYMDSTGIYDHPTILKARPAGSTLGIDFFAMKSYIAPVVIIDTDAVIRWVGTNAPSMSVIFTDNGFVVGDTKHPTFQRVELDGTLRAGSVADPTVTAFHHNIDPGKQGLLVEVDNTSGGGSLLAEMAPDGTLIKTWDMVQILGDYMTSRGDDPSQLVRPDDDWFHLNAATYDPSDDSVIVSSREQFLIKVGYGSGDVRWILGDPTKLWGKYPSLRAKALHVPDGGPYPIGQHSTSITSDGLLLLFDDGFNSQHVPDGGPKGENRDRSFVSAYAIDPGTMTARIVWQFDNGLYSRVCSSAYEGKDQSVLVDYAVSDGGTTTRIIGLDSTHQPVFDFAYANPGGRCNTGWNAVPVPMDDLRFE